MTCKQRIGEYFADILCECDEDDITAEEVISAFVEELDKWSAYHKTAYDKYEAIRAALGERVRQA